MGSRTHAHELVYCFLLLTCIQWSLANNYANTNTDVLSNKLFFFLHTEGGEELPILFVSSLIIAFLVFVSLHVLPRIARKYVMAVPRHGLGTYVRRFTCVCMHLRTDTCAVRIETRCIWGFSVGVLRIHESVLFPHWTTFSWNTWYSSRLLIVACRLVLCLGGLGKKKNPSKSSILNIKQGKMFESGACPGSQENKPHLCLCVCVRNRSPRKAFLSLAAFFIIQQLKRTFLQTPHHHSRFCSSFLRPFCLLLSHFTSLLSSASSPAGT